MTNPGWSLPVLSPGARGGHFLCPQSDTIYIYIYIYICGKDLSAENDGFLENTLFDCLVYFWSTSTHFFTAWSIHGRPQRTASLPGPFLVDLKTLFDCLVYFWSTSTGLPLALLPCQWPSPRLISIQSSVGDGHGLTPAPLGKV